MRAEWEVVSGIVVEGHRVASLPSVEYPYPTLEKQKPHFKERGLDLEKFFAGTLNISIAPHQFEMLAPEFTFPLVAWTDLHPPETFSFSPCRLRFHRKEYKGLVYYPHPETKVRHFKEPSLIEVLAPRIAGITYGEAVELFLDSHQIWIR